MTTSILSSDELERLLGDSLRALRIRHNITQRALALRANVSLGAVQNAESGRGATLRTLVRLVRALGRVDWLESLAPQVTARPLEALKSGARTPRQRASAPRGAGKPGV